MPSEDRPQALGLDAAVALGLGVSLRLVPLARPAWFGSLPWSDGRRRFATDLSLVVIATGVVGLVTLASSAALRYQPSLQFLQLLSALDIAWAGAAIVGGAHRVGGRLPAIIGGIALGVVCVASIWNYLRVAGFSPGGGWALRRSEVVRLVLPFDAMAAVIAVALLIAGARRP